MGDPSRFRTGKQFRSFTGLVPRADETGDTDRKGQTMSKAGSSLLRATLVRAADTARKQDPQLARIYYLQMIERGKNHLGALCVVAANLAERAWAVMNRGTPYVIRDTDGTPVTANQAAAIIAQHWTVPTEVRSRRRSKKGKAPQAISTRRHQQATFPTTHRRALTPTGSTRRRHTPDNASLDSRDRHRESECPLWCFAARQAAALGATVDIERAGWRLTARL